MSCAGIAMLIQSYSGRVSWSMPNHSLRGVRMGGAQFRGKNNGALSFALWSWNCVREFLIRVLPVVVGPSQCYVEVRLRWKVNFRSFL